MQHDIRLVEHHQLHGLQPVLPVSSVAAAAAWFRDTLGFDIEFLIGEPATYGRVMLGTLGEGSWGAPIYIHLRSATQPVQPCGELRLHVGHDIDALHAIYRERGASVQSPPADQPWGLREFTLRTPDGYTLIFGAEVAAAGPLGERP